MTRRQSNRPDGSRILTGLFVSLSVNSQIRQVFAYPEKLLLKDHLGNYFELLQRSGNEYRSDLRHAPSFIDRTGIKNWVVFFSSGDFAFQFTDGFSCNGVDLVFNLDIGSDPIVVNQPPIAVDDGPILFSTLDPVRIDMVGGTTAGTFADQDPEGDSLQVIRINNRPISAASPIVAVQDGEVRLVAGQFYYIWNGSRPSRIKRFRYTISDNQGNTDVGQVRLRFIVP